MLFDDYRDGFPQHHQLAASSAGPKASSWRETVPQADKEKISSQASGSKYRTDCYPQSWTAAYTADGDGQMSR